MIGKTNSECDPNNLIDRIVCQRRRWILYSGWLTAFMMGVLLAMSVIWNINSRVKKDKIQAIVDIALPKVEQQIEDIKKKSDSTYASRYGKETDMYISAYSDTALKLDTVENALISAANRGLKVENKGLRDSTFLLASRIIELSAEVERIKKDKTVITFTTPPLKYDTAKKYGVYVFEYKKKKGYFSPDRKYLNISNGYDKLDYELASPDIYQFMLQVRGSYNPVSGRKLVGIGAELKLNNFSLNFVNSYDENAPNKFFNPTFGVRYDVFKMPIR